MATSRIQRCCLAAVVGAALATTWRPAVPQTLYWTTYNPPKVQRGDAAGGVPVDLVTSFGGGNPGDLALDRANGHMYWLNTPTPGTRIQRANLDGSDVGTVLALTNGSLPHAIALDLTAGRMYWTSEALDTIEVADLDGTDLSTLIPGLADPYGIALDVPAGKIYWANFFGTIQRANLDGSGTKDVIPVKDLAPLRVRLDRGRGKVYWTDFNGDLYRADLDGGNVQFVVAARADAFALDTVAGHIYFGQLSGVIGIRRCDPDGSNVVTLFPGIPLVNGLVIDMPGDCNSDGEVDLFDYRDFQPCLAGPALAVALGCLCHDLDGSDTVDLADFAKTQAGLSGQ